MGNKKTEPKFEYNVRRWLVYYWINHMSRQQVEKVALYYFDDCREEVALRLVKKIAYSPSKTRQFLDTFPLPFWKQLAPHEDIIDDALYSPSDSNGFFTEKPK